MVPGAALDSWVPKTPAGLRNGGGSACSTTLLKPCWLGGLGGCAGRPGWQLTDAASCSHRHQDSDLAGANSDADLHRHRKKKKKKKRHSRRSQDLAKAPERGLPKATSYGTGDRWHRGEGSFLLATLPGESLGPLRDKAKHLRPEGRASRCRLSEHGQGKRCSLGPRK